MITGVHYPNLSKLSEQFPYITPQPSDIEEWVKIAQNQNWSIKATQFAAFASRQSVKQQQAGHLPNLTAQGLYGYNFTHVISNDLAGTSISSGGGTSTTPGPLPVDEDIFPTGVTKTRSLSANLSLNIPIAQGGYVVASTRKAQYNYRIAISQFEQQVRKTINNTRQSYLNIMSGISKIKADKQTIKSTTSSLEGMQAAYEVGTETLVDVLNQQQKVFKAQTQYAADRYAYVNSLLELKAAAGTLCFKDLEAINSWLSSER